MITFSGFRSTEEHLPTDSSSRRCEVWQCQKPETRHQLPGQRDQGKGDGRTTSAQQEVSRQNDGSARDARIGEQLNQII